jgi:hypothetical protein
MRLRSLTGLVVVVRHTASVLIGVFAIAVLSSCHVLVHYTIINLFS